MILKIKDTEFKIEVNNDIIDFLECHDIVNINGIRYYKVNNVMYECPIK